MEVPRGLIPAKPAISRSVASHRKPTQRSGRGHGWGAKTLRAGREGKPGEDLDKFPAGQ